MAVDTGSGSPGATLGDSGAGSPVPGASGDTGAGSPVAFPSVSGGGVHLAMELRRPFSSDEEHARHGFDPAYPEDGGRLAEVAAAWPVAGPYGVALRDADGVDWSCPSGKRGQGAEIYPNESRAFLRFVVPKLRVGTYDLVVSWAGGGAVSERAVRIVPRALTRHTTQQLEDFGTFKALERRPQDVT